MTGNRYSFVRHGRSTRLAAVLIGVYAALAALLILFDAAPWLVTLLALPTLPALFEYGANRSAGLELDPEILSWHSGRRSGRLDLGEIDHVRLDTRWDFSVRATAVLTDGAKVRLPGESLPPHRDFQQVLEKAGTRVERHHFRVF